VQVPEVRRDSTGTLLDARGRPVIGKGGIGIKHWSDKRAVRTGRFIRNPEMWKRLPWLDERDLIALCYPSMPSNAANRRWYLAQSRKVLKALDATGVIAIEREFPDAPRERLKGRWKIALPDTRPTHSKRT